MKLSHLALASLTFFGLAVIGCKNNEDKDDDVVDSSESQLVADDQEVANLDDEVEVGLDEPLSGAAPNDPGSPATGGSDDEVSEKLRVNPGLFFRPAGCIVSTRAGNQITHVFTNCTGPYGLAHFNGTVVTTYAREPGKLTVTHDATGFEINRATVSGQRVVEYTLDGAIISKHRTGNWSGSTAKGREVSHQANFVTTYDAASRCITRDGTAETTIGGRSFERTVEGYKRCGIGRGGCPESGTVVLSRTKQGETGTVTIEFLGGPQYRVTGPRGGQATLPLTCNANAS